MRSLWYTASYGVKLREGVSNLDGDLSGSSEENEFHMCFRVEGRGKGLSGQFFFVCEKDDREKSSMKSLGGMTRPEDEMGSQIVSP